MLFALKRAYFFVIDNWRTLLPIAGLLVVLVLVFFAYKGCKREKSRLNEAEIQKAEEAIRQRNDKELQDILANVDVREKQINADLVNAETEKLKAIQESKQKYANYNTSQLAEELEKRK